MEKVRCGQERAHHLVAEAPCLRILVKRRGLEKIACVDTFNPILRGSCQGRIPIVESGWTVYKMTAGSCAEHAKALKDLGVRVIGGCCGTTPEHIRAVRTVLGA